jgi:hypothetical protein
LDWIGLEVEVESSIFSTEEVMPTRFVTKKDADFEVRMMLDGFSVMDGAIRD